VATDGAALCTLQVISAGGWAYIIGQAAGMVATLNPNAVLFHTTMDQLNYFMSERNLPKEMRMMLREFFQNARRVHQGHTEAELIGKMSPLLQGAVAVRANRAWLAQIWFLRDLNSTREEREFIAELAMRLRVAAFVSNERMPIGQLYVLQKGMAVRMWRFLRRNAVWGDDMLLNNAGLIDHAQAVALTYVEALTLSRPAFEEVAVHFALATARVRKAMRRVLAQRALMRYLAIHAGGVGARSFVAREMASGYSYVSSFQQVLHAHARGQMSLAASGAARTSTSTGASTSPGTRKSNAGRSAASPAALPPPTAAAGWAYAGLSSSGADDAMHSDDGWRSGDRWRGGGSPMGGTEEVRGGELGSDVPTALMEHASELAALRDGQRSAAMQLQVVAQTLQRLESVVGTLVPGHSHQEGPLNALTV
jgi:hypothetical protein